MLTGGYPRYFTLGEALYYSCVFAISIAFHVRGRETGGPDILLPLISGFMSMNSLVNFLCRHDEVFISLDQSTTSTIASVLLVVMLRTTLKLGKNAQLNTTWLSRLRACVIALQGSAVFYGCLLFTSLQQNHQHQLVIYRIGSVGLCLAWIGQVAILSCIACTIRKLPFLLMASVFFLGLRYLFNGVVAIELTTWTESPEDVWYYVGLSHMPTALVFATLLLDSTSTGPAEITLPIEPEKQHNQR